MPLYRNKSKKYDRMNARDIKQQLDKCEKFYVQIDQDLHNDTGFWFAKVERNEVGYLLDTFLRSELGDMPLLVSIIGDALYLIPMQD